MAERRVAVLAYLKIATALTIALAATAPVTGAALAGVYRGAGCLGRDRMAAFETTLGRKADLVTEFTENGDWAHMLSSVDWALGCWRGKGYRLSQSVPMLMAHGQSLAEGAAGDYDPQFVALGKLLVARGHADAFLRIGWEFNGSWYSWAAAKDPANFKAYFRRIVAAFRSVPGQHFRIVWNPSMGEQQIAPDKVYPGDDVVDVIGLDLYNQSWRPQDYIALLRWRNMVGQPFGLDWLASFAAAHHKPMALPEWGTGTRPDGHGWGDDPMFIRNMAEWIRHHDVVYQAYWDYKAGDFDGEISSGRQPLSAAAFRAGFGPGS